jgi:hypothetical protein
MFCAPGVKNSNSITCYNKEDLLLLIKAYNKNKNPSSHITTSKKSKKQLWLDLHEKMSKDCQNEWCWLEQDFIPSSYSRKLQENFKPTMPDEWKQNPFEWLSNVDIELVMKQYEKKFVNFLFLGVFPVDCPEEIQCELTNIQIETIINKLGKTRLGIVYNLDKHNQPGSHWVSVYIDCKKGVIMYFDSNGIEPPILIHNFLLKIQKQLQEYYTTFIQSEKKVEVFINTTQFQFGNSECGVFSMNFIISHLQGKNISKKNTNDETMNELRKKYYKPK